MIQPGSVGRQGVAGRADTRADDREALLRLAEATASTRDLPRILQAVSDAGVQLAGAEFGAFFSNADDVALLICDVIGTRARHETATMRLPVGPDVVARARAFTRETLSRWGCEAVVDDATLLVSEMVTNATRHTDGESVLTLRREVDRVEITVTDTETRPPSPTLRFEPTATSGRAACTSSTRWRRRGASNPPAPARASGPTC